VKSIQEKSWREKDLCSHSRTTWARLQTSNGLQIKLTCVDCGYRQGGPAPHHEHPDAASYPVLVKHDGTPEQAPSRQVTSEQYAAYLASTDWRAKRSYYLGRAMFRCQLCYERGGPTSGSARRSTPM
jgi:hypothetical protein